MSNGQVLALILAQVLGAVWALSTKWLPPGMVTILGMAIWGGCYWLSYVCRPQEESK